MADDFGVQTKGLQEFGAYIERIAKMQGLKLGIKAGGVHVRGVATRYPARGSISRASVYGRTFESVAQQGAFFAKLKSGAITVPYRRTRALANQFGMREEDDGLTQVIGTNTPYAEQVMGDKQSRLHEAIGWKKLSAIGRDEAGAVNRIVVREVGRMIRTRGTGTPGGIGAGIASGLGRR